MATRTFGIYQKGTSFGASSAEQAVAISGADWIRHTYCIGSTGSGKTNLLKYLMAQDSAFCLIDKEGDLAAEIADSVPCIYWRASDYSFPIGLNPLIEAERDERSRRTAEIVAMFSDIWGLGEHTPQLLHQLRATVRLLLENPGSTLLDIPRVLSDDDFRDRKLVKCKDRWTRQVWAEFRERTKRERRDDTKSLLNKAHALASSLPLQLALGQQTSTINFRKIMDAGQTVVCDLSGIGDEPAKLLGAVIIFSIAQAAYSRTGDERPEYTLYIDEFEDFCSLTMPGLLSKSRKRGLALCIAHQYVSQLDLKIAEAILANCGTLVSFRVGVNDAPILAKALDTSAQYLLDAEQGRPWIAPLRDGMRGKAVPIDVPLADLATGHLRGNVQNTRHRYARTRKEVERRFEIEDWLSWKAKMRRKKKQIEKEIVKVTEGAEEWG